jgi:hypothetical protein
MTELHQFDPRLYGQSKDYPREVIPIMDAVLRGIAEKEFNMLPEDSFQVGEGVLLPGAACCWHSEACGHQGVQLVTPGATIQVTGACSLLLLC